MKQIEIRIDPDNTAYEAIQTELRKNLAALETIRFRTISEPVGPGTLTGGEQIVGFVIEHYDKLVPLVSSVLTIATQILAWTRKPRDKDRDKPLVIIIGGEKIKLPSSPEARRRFLKKLEEGAKEHSGKNKDQPKRKNQKRGRSR